MNRTPRACPPLAQPFTRPLLLLLLLLLLAPACSETTGPGAGGDGGDTVAVPEVSSDAPPTDSGDATEPATCPGCFPPASCVSGFCVISEDEGCTPGETRGCYPGNAVMTCDPTGTAFVPIPCPAEQNCLGGTCRSAICLAGESICEGLTSKKACNADGSGFLASTPCPEGQYCTSGKCGSSCEIDPKFGSYVGCAFWTVDLPNYNDPTSNPPPRDLPHALVISNPGELSANISFEPPPGVIIAGQTQPVVDGRSSKVFMMPVLSLVDTETSFKGIRVVSSRPVLVHQFNPWDNTFSNDASLLLPETFLGSEYVVLSWPTSPLELIPIPILPAENQAGFFTVLAPFDGTEVTIRVSAPVKGGGKLQAMAAGGLQTITLDRGEVLNVEAAPTSLFETADLTGSLVSATKPVAVFAGHEEAVIGPPNAGQPTFPGDDDPDSLCCADHMEEQMLPRTVLGFDYVAVKSRPRGSEPDFWRIQAADDNVTVTLTPPQDGKSTFTLQNRGDWVEVITPESFEISATGFLQVGQYLVSQTATDDFIGDPSMILLVPNNLFRETYAIAVPPSFKKNYVTVIKPAGATVSLDDVAVPQTDFLPIAASGWERAYLELPQGVHELSGTARFGLSAYGFDGPSSYGYPGGIGDPGE